MLTFKEQKLKEFREKYNYTSFTWNGDVFDGEKIAKQTRREVIAFLSSTIDEAEIKTLKYLQEVETCTNGSICSAHKTHDVAEYSRLWLVKLGGVKE